MLVLEREIGKSIVIGGFLKVIITGVTENNEVQFGLWPTEYPTETTPKTDTEKTKKE